jgi:hypothetical protein
MRRTLSILIPALLYIVVGCGGGGTVGVSDTRATGRATFTVKWPPPSTRLIPAAANSIVVVLTQGTTTLATQTLARPATGSTASATFNSLPAGTLTVTATAYPNANGTGTPQATATTSIVIQANQNTPFGLTMASTIQQITVSPATVSLEAGQFATLTATALDANGNVVLTAPNNIQWASANTLVATVDTTGKVTAVSAGTVQITVTELESGRKGAASLTVTPAGTLLIYDGYNYPVGSGINNQNGGFGWSNAWNEYGQGFTPSVITQGSLSYGNLLTTGNAVQSTSDNPTGNARTFAQTYGQTGTQLYFSLLVRVLDPIAGSDPYFGFVINGKVFAGAGGSPPYFGLSLDGGSGAILSNIVAQQNQTYFLVVRITFKDGPDVIDLFVNPPLGQPLPATPDVTKSDVDLGTVVGFNLGGSLRSIYDEFRVGTTYGAVSPTQ